MSSGTDIGQGDSESAYLDVAPADNTTVAALLVHRPDGTSTPFTASGGTLTPIPDTSPVQYSQRWTTDTPVVYNQPGKWVLSWTVTGTGEGAEDLEVWVVASPIAGGPTWAPGRSRVANYVPHRTLASSASSIIGSQDTYELTFDSTTRPTGIQIDRLIADGIDWITTLVTPLHPTSQPAAALLAALWAAISAERSWPNDEQSLSRANDMEKRLDSLLAALLVSNGNANNDSGTEDPAVHPLPVWSFPPAPCDDLSYGWRSPYRY